MHPGMKRWTLRILLGLILGAVTTVAVAWFFAWRQIVPDSRQSEFSGLDTLLTPIHELDDDYPLAVEPVPLEYKRWISLRTNEVEPIAINLSNADIYLGYEELWFYGSWRDHSGEEWMDDPWEMHTYPSLARVQAGSPASALVCFVYRYGREESLIDGIELEVDTGIELAPGYPIRLPRYLPFRPIWPGFLIDTLFYGVIWLVLFFGVGAVRRGVRRRRGRCVMCGYDLRGQRQESPHPQPLSHGERGASGAGCPECGWGRAADDGDG